MNLTRWAAVVAGLVILALPAFADPPAASETPSATRALFRYQRENAVPNGVTRVRVNAARVAAIPDSPDVMGNFIEHLGDVVYHTLWADVLMNPNLERLEDDNPMPPYWDTRGKTDWRGDTGYQSPRSVRLSAPDGSLSQAVFPPAYRERCYTLTLYVRAPAEAGRVRLALRKGDEPAGVGTAVAQADVPVSGIEWQKKTFHWTLAPGALAKGQAARFFITHAGGGSVDVDWVDLFPDDAIAHMDPDAVKAARAWNIPILRQAGNFESGYHWRDGVGPRLERPTYRNPAWGGVETNQFGTDEFLDLCWLIGAEPQMGANAGNGTPEEAAGWVRYTRTKNPRIQLWEIGNELYGGWQIGHTDAAGNADRYVRFRAAMLAVDPTLRLMATGKGDEFSPGGMANNLAWNDAVLRAAGANGAPYPDYLTIHPLVGLNGPGGGSYSDLYESAMAHPAYIDQTHLPALERQIVDIEGPQGRTRIAPTEWGIIVGGPDWYKGPNHDVLAGAVFNALTLNAFLRHGDWVTLANMTALLHGGAIKKDRGVVYVDPQYYTQKLYADAAPRWPVQTDWSGPGRDVPSRFGLPAASDVPDVDVFSALAPDKDRLTVFLVNRLERAARSVHLDLAGFAAGRPMAMILTAPGTQDRNSWDHPDAIRPRPFTLPTGNVKHGWTFSVPAHSLVVLRVGKAKR